MEFERIGKNTIQCRMTVEEMSEYGLRIEDFFTNQEKSRSFLESLVERAEEEVGYEVESGMISMQLMRMPDDSLIITFSDKGEDSIQNMLNQMQNITEVVQEDSEEDEDAYLFQELGASAEKEIQPKGEDSFVENRKEQDTAFRQHMKDVETKRQKKLKQKLMASKVFRFNSLDAVETFAASIKLEKNVPSKLYKDRQTGTWYLFVKKGKLKLEEYQELCLLLQEYAVLCSQQPYVEQYCREHYDCIIEKQALKLIKNYICQGNFHEI